ncbi:C-X-C chemokine receptor type 3.1 isoform X1 [Oncorhynchus kisutch]|uniref:C-X-C chemokine receptor type 3.1 isoform X1 n=2 Tax=Oncorhynchus kisutch TaxID=8019 RepID=UPI0009A00F9A|nr:C-X-C chemokine receptor type 3-like isoform X1 [Oncorhynchus kisutch]
MDSLMVNGEKFTINISVSDLEYYYDKEYSNYTDTSDTCCSTGEVCSLEEGMSFDAVFLPVFYSLTLVLRLLGNGLVLLVLVQRRRGWSVTDTFILHLCVADILLLLTLPLWAAQAAEEWSFGTPLCKITGAIFTINFYCGIFLLACISLDRYLSVVHAVQMYSRRKPWMVQASCLSVWLLSILLSIPDWHFLESVMDTRRDKQECVHNYPSLSQSGFDWRLASRLLYHTVGFLLPSAVLLFCYSCILLRLQRGSQGLQKQRAVRVILALVLVFFLCWTPYNITLMVDTLYSNNTLEVNCESHKALDISLTATSSLGYLHCSLNPVLYSFVGVKFRHHLLDMLRSLGCKLKSGVRLQTASRRSSMWSESGDTSHTSAIY